MLAEVIDEQVVFSMLAEGRPVGCEDDFVAGRGPVGIPVIVHVVCQPRQDALFNIPDVEVACSGLVDGVHDQALSVRSPRRRAENNEVFKMIRFEHPVTLHIIEMQGVVLAALRHKGEDPVGRDVEL